MLPNRVLVAMSGGVDSSVAAALLVERGFDVIGATMKLFSDGTDVPDRPCCSLDSVNDARRVCERLGIPHYVLNLESRFGHDVMDDFVAEYVAGRTPIPCVRCNTFTKFRDLLHTADSVDAQWIATGHYARVENDELLRGRDDSKDQTYFLWGIDRRVIARMILPVGSLTKAETRAIATRLGLTMVANKPDSQEICFVPDGDYVKIIAERAGADSPALQRGPIVHSDGRVLGEHDGYARFTVGQRRGLPGGFAEPLYVVAIRPAERAVVVGGRDALLGTWVLATGVNWLVADPPREGDAVQVRIRHRAPLAGGTIRSLAGTRLEIALDQPTAAISPGQSLVIYSGERVLGGGFIGSSQTARSLPLLAV
ncbi:MAG: tRNA 2-thiouridine(34) synthase MnmA [Gemmatimonadota bacterium]|nr:tRNA 2-thiouridine(34) synthase MnmA [Gemmatimonadota bacterium]